MQDEGAPALTGVIGRHRGAVPSAPAPPATTVSDVRIGPASSATPRRRLPPASQPSVVSRALASALATARGCCTTGPLPPGARDRSPHGLEPLGDGRAAGSTVWQGQDGKGARPDGGVHGPPGLQVHRLHARGSSGTGIRSGLVQPSVQGTGGRPGVPRLYSFRDLVALRVVKSLLDGGMSLQRVRRSWEFLNKKAGLDKHLSEVKLVTDGQSIFKICRRDGEVMDALNDGQMAFFVAIDDIATGGADQRRAVPRGSRAVRAGAPRGRGADRHRLLRLTPLLATRRYGPAIRCVDRGPSRSIARTTESAASARPPRRSPIGSSARTRRGSRSAVSRSRCAAVEPCRSTATARRYSSERLARSPRMPQLGRALGEHVVRREDQARAARLRPCAAGAAGASARTGAASASATPSADRAARGPRCAR